MNARALRKNLGKEIVTGIFRNEGWNVGKAHQPFDLHLLDARGRVQAFVVCCAYALNTDIPLGGGHAIEEARILRLRETAREYDRAGTCKVILAFVDDVLGLVFRCNLDKLMCEFRVLDVDYTPVTLPWIKGKFGSNEPRDRQYYWPAVALHDVFGDKVYTIQREQVSELRKLRDVRSKKGMARRGNEDAERSEWREYLAAWRDSQKQESLL